MNRSKNASYWENMKVITDSINRSHLNDVARLHPALDAHPSLELLALAGFERRLHETRSGVRGAYIAPWRVRLQHQLFPRDGSDYLRGVEQASSTIRVRTAIGES